VPDAPGAPSAQELSVLPAAELAARLAEAYRLIGELTARNERLAARVEDLERRDSPVSSRPPSSDSPYKKKSRVSALRAVAVSAEQLKVVDSGGPAQGHREEVVILKIEFAAALGALAAVSFVDCPADVAGDGLPLSLWPLLSAFVDVEQYVSAVQALSGPALAVSDQRQDIALRVIT
jgi:hypothetical protein